MTKPSKTREILEDPEKTPVAALESESPKAPTHPANAPYGASVAVEFPGTLRKLAKCPRCGHISTDPVKLGPPNGSRCYIQIEGVAYHSQSVQRIKCEECGQVHIVKTYHEE